MKKFIAHYCSEVWATQTIKAENEEQAVIIAQAKMGEDNWSVSDYNEGFEFRLVEEEKI